MDEFDLMLRLLAALTAGGIIGLERSYRGRAAGLRTYALVALGAALLVGTAHYAPGWAPKPGAGDPTRVVQGIVTGIGFLGAGVILREGFSVRGLTTAASIWVTAAIGVAFGAGLFHLGAGATAATWIALEVLRRVEARVPVHSLVHCHVTFARVRAWEEARVIAAVRAKGFNISEISYSLDAGTQMVVFELVMWSRDVKAPSALQESLLVHPEVVGFRVTPGRD